MELSELDLTELKEANGCFPAPTDSCIRQIVVLCRVLLDHRRHANGTETMRKLHDTLSKCWVCRNGSLGGVCQSLYWGGFFYSWDIA